MSSSILDNHLEVGIGLPLDRFQTEKSYLQFYKEQQFLSRTSEYVPTPKPHSRHVKKKLKDLSAFATGFMDLELNDRTAFGLDSFNTTRQFDLLDPLKGNSLISSTYLDSILYLFSAGATLSQLVVGLTTLEPFEVRRDSTVKLPLDQLTVLETIDLQYPIRQITFSPIENVPKVFIVRTTSSIHVFSLNQDRVLRELQRVFLADETLINSDIDYSMPMHVEASPYHLYQYLFITNNGYVSIRDAYNNKILFEEIDPLPDDLTYLSRWKSCAFGPTPSTIYIASPNSIVLWEIREDKIQTKTLVTTNTPITAFTTSKSRSMYCFGTAKSIILFDLLFPKPIMTYKHRFTQGPPSVLSLESVSKDQWRMYGFSHSCQRFFLVDFEYINSPTKSVIRKVTVKRTFNFGMSTNDFGEVSVYPNLITSMGIALNTLDKEDNKEFLSIERLFEDGSIRIQYVQVSHNKPSEAMELMTKPAYQIIPNTGFKYILQEAIIFSLPKLNQRGGPALIELRHIDLKDLDDYVEHKSTATNKLSDDVKTEIASKVRQLTCPTVFSDLFDNESYLQYDTNDLLNFLRQLESHENVEITHQIHIPHIMKTNSSIQPELASQLNEVHDKKMTLGQSILRPLREDNVVFEQSNPLQYLSHADVLYESTTTTKVLAQLYPIQSISYKDMVFPELDTTQAPQTEIFPTHRTTRKRTMQEIGLPNITVEEDEEEEFSLPTILETNKGKKIHATQEQTFLEPPSPARSFTAISTQPLPGAFGSRKKSVTKKKKKTKTMGFK